MASDFTERDPIISIRGENVGLGSMDPAMIPKLTAWINDFETVRLIGLDPRPGTQSQEEDWLRANTSDPKQVLFAIYDLEDMALVGSTRLFDIDHRHGTCELGIAILDQSRRGKGLGTEAVRLITDYAFHGLEMHSLGLGVFEYNYAGQRAYRRAGFKEYGRRREAHFLNGRWWDVIFMDVLASEWESPVVKEMMAPEERR